VSNSGINYTYFLLIKIPKAGSIPATNSAKFLERYDYAIMPIVWMEKHGWTRQHIDDIEGRSSNEIDAVIPLDYKTKRMEWAILKKPNNNFINWPIRNPMEVKE
jgi:hypothetical protein